LSPAPFFSVIIPTRNRANLLRESVLSVLAQSFPDFELIIVDDHSEDNTTETLSGLSDPRVKSVLNDRSKGGAGSRNAGIFRARGEWICFLDDDDIWLKGKLEAQYRKIRSVDQETGLVYSGAYGYDPANRKILCVYKPKIQGWVQRDLLYRNYIGTYSTVVIRKDLLLELNGLDERFPALQDIELYVRIAGRAKIAFVVENLALIRRVGGDRISADPGRKLEGSLLLRAKFTGLLEKEPRLKHAIAARIFTYGIRTGSWGHVLGSLPWTCVGLALAPSNFLSVLKSIAVLILRDGQQRNGRERAR